MRAVNRVWADAINLFSVLHRRCYKFHPDIFKLSLRWCRETKPQSPRKPHSKKLFDAKQKVVAHLAESDVNNVWKLSDGKTGNSSTHPRPPRALAWVLKGGRKIFPNHSSFHQSLCQREYTHTQHQLTIYCVASEKTKEHVSLCHHPKLKTFISAWHKRIVSERAQICMDASASL